MLTVCSDLAETVDDNNKPCIKVTLSPAIKQNQGGLKMSKGQQKLLDHPSINVYDNTSNSFMSIKQWLADNDAYRAAAAADATPVKELFMYCVTKPEPNRPKDVLPT